MAPLFLVAGCAPASFQQGVPWSINRYRTASARTRTVNGKPFLRVDDYLLDRLSNIDKSADKAQATEQLDDLLEQAHALAVTAITDEIDRLPPAAIDQLWQRYFSKETKPDNPRRAIRKRYLDSLQRDYDAFRKQVDTAQTADEVRQLAHSIVRDAGPSVKDQRGGGSLLKMVSAKYERATPKIDNVKGPFDVYEPGEIDKTQSSGGAAAEALARFAPILFQQHADKPNYPPLDDQIGAVSLSGTAKNITVHIHPDKPVLYAYTHRAIVGGKDHLQLVYCWWFPRHPAMSSGDPEAGNIDGATIRVTLDSRGRPAVVETIQNCGCHIRSFASADLENRARREHPEVGNPDAVALEKPNGDKPRLDVSQIFESPQSGDNWQMVVFSRAGYHDVVAVSTDLAGMMASRQIASRHNYDLRPYDTLEHLPTRFGHASMFGPDGLVHNAGRLEGWLLAPTGMRSAGQPRQRGTQLICWDELNFDDPHLLEDTLRLPSDF